MRKVTKKALSLVLATAMTISMAGCGKDETEQTQNTPSGEKTEQAGRRRDDVCAFRRAKTQNPSKRD